MRRKRKGPNRSPDKDSADAIAYLWKWLSVGLFVYCVGLWIRTQTADFEPVKILAKSHDLAVIAGLFASPFILLSLSLAGRYARLKDRCPLPERVPCLFEKAMKGVIGKQFRLWSAIGLLTLAVASQIHFLRIVLFGQVLDSLTGDRFSGPVAMLTKWPPSGRNIFLNDYHFGSHAGPTFFPVVESWLWLVLVMLILVRYGVYLWRDLKVLSA